MRDPKRIDAMLGLIGQIWKELPDLRLIQLIHNANDGDFNYYTEDDKLMEALQRAYAGRISSGS